jgi:hypothetical protein
MATNEAVRLAADDDRAPGEAPAVKRGVLLPCPCCGQEEATITVSLADGDTLYCEDCSTSFSLDLVRGFVAKWSRMVAYIESMPGAE